MIYAVIDTNVLVAGCGGIANVAASSFGVFRWLRGHRKRGSQQFWRFLLAAGASQTWQPAVLAFFAGCGVNANVAAGGFGVFCLLRRHRKRGSQQFWRFLLAAALTQTWQPAVLAFFACCGVIANVAASSLGVFRLLRR